MRQSQCLNGFKFQILTLIWQKTCHIEILHVHLKYTDANYVGSVVYGRLTTIYCNILGGNLMTWRCKKLDMAAQSSAEEEWRAMTQSVCELIWLKIIFENLKIKWDRLMRLYCDNKPAICIARNLVYDWMKHIKIDKHIVKDKLESILICIPYVSTHGQLVNILYG